jgi:hypothetical protein
VRASAAALCLATALLVSGCGSDGGERQSAPRPGTLEALLDRPGPDVALIQGTSDLATGIVRLSFLVITDGGRPVERPRARVWVAKSLDAKPLARTSARLEPIGIPGTSEAAVGDVQRIYVARIPIRRPGRYVLLAEPVGGAPIQGIGNLDVNSEPTAPAIGERAVPSRTPTLSSTGGDVQELTTRVPPDRSLLVYSIADSLAARVPFVVTFATPKFCTSRVCGPVVDVVEAVQRRFRETDARFIHVEVYKDNNPAQGPNRWYREWRLPSEPFTFLVGRDGHIKARFEGAFSAQELTAAIRRYLIGDAGAR